MSCVNFDPADPEEAWPAGEDACERANLVRPVSVRDCGGGRCHFGAWRTENVGVSRRSHDWEGGGASLVLGVYEGTYEGLGARASVEARG